MKRFVSLLIALLLILALPLGAGALGMGNEQFVYDDADLLTDGQERALSEKLQAVSSSYNAQIVVATLASSGGSDADTLVNYLYDSMGFGYGENHDGVLLLLCMDTRQYRILSNGFASDAISEVEIEEIGEDIVSALSDGDYAEAFETFADRCAYYLDGHINGFPFDAGGTLGICLIIGIGVGLIVAFMLKGQLKSVREENRAHVYIKNGSMQVNVHRDLYLYRNVTRTKKQTSSSSGSRSGSSRSVGGGSF